MAKGPSNGDKLGWSGSGEIHRLRDIPYGRMALVLLTIAVPVAGCVLLITRSAGRAVAVGAFVLLWSAAILFASYARTLHRNGSLYFPPPVWNRPRKG